MKPLLIVALLASAAVADSTCPAKGTPIFEARHLVEKSREKVVTTLHASGALSIASTQADGTPGQSGSGCLDKDQLAKVKADLKASPWKITKAQIRCHAVSTSYTEYYVDGKRVYTKHLCGEDILDDKSAKNLDEIESLLKK